jgi:hypothetical protein
LKILQNPIAVIVLSLVAVVLIATQVAWPMMQRSHWMQHAPEAASPAPAASLPAPLSQQVKPNQTSALLAKATPEASIDVSAASSSAARLAEASRRDPFQSKFLFTNQAKAYPPARELLTFTSYWRQTGSTVAIINDRVISVGDTILGFKVESIDHDSVRVVGPNGRETVEFGRTHASSQAGVQTNSTPVAMPDY